MWPIPVDDSTWFGHLQTAGVVPHGENEKVPTRDFSNVVDWLIAVWSEHSIRASTQQAKQARHVVTALKSANRQAAWLDVVPPGCDHETCKRWLGARLFWSNNSPFTGQRLAVLSSHVGRTESLQRLWLEALHRSLSEAPLVDPILVAVDGTTAARFIERAALQRDLRLMTYHFSARLRRPSDWFAMALTTSVEDTQDRASRRCPVFVSPALASSSVEESVLAGDPQQDRLLMISADHLEVLLLRRGGTTDALVRSRLVEARHRVSCRLAADPALIAVDLAGELIALGAGAPETTNHDVPCPPVGPMPEPTSIARLPSPVDRDLLVRVLTDRTTDWEFLTHWTRAAEAVPLQKLSDPEIDQMLRDPGNCDRSAFGSLKEILRSERLKATRNTLRGPVPMVCFSAVPLNDLLQRRTYRVHRTRWDCEHFGLCIRRTVLQKLGAREVLYGTETDFERMTEADRPWFQRQPERASSKQIDWSLEAEWRLPGDLDLSLIPRDDGFLFVPSELERSRLTSLSAWPVITVEELSRLTRD